MNNSALFTDFYELTMAQGYWKRQSNHKAVFDMFFRRQPFSGGFSVFSGLDPLLDAIESFRFSPEDIAFLDSQKKFEQGFLDYLSNFRFTGEIHAMKEGTIVFPNEPLLRIHANIIEAEIIEGLILNTINFQSLISTKTARVFLAANRGSLMEFGLRRAQGYDGAMSASRAAYIGGATGTSNTLAGKEFGIPVMGTMAHSWIMSFPSEEEAFDAYAEIYPDSSVFLIDTYNTLESGVKAAIASGKRLAAKGHGFGVRLDSGDIEYLSNEVRKALDEAGLDKATITVSNELTEEIIESLVLNKAPINSWGVGTHMVTGGDEASFTGVYKLAARAESNGQLIPTMKLSDNPEKTTNPGIKQVWRLYDEKGTIKADALSLEDSPVIAGQAAKFYHPTNDLQSFQFMPSAVEGLLEPVMSQGKRLKPHTPLVEIRERVQGGLSHLDRTYQRILNPHVYKVSLSEELRTLKLEMLRSYGR